MMVMNPVSTNTSATAGPTSATGASATSSASDNPTGSPSATSATSSTTDTSAALSRRRRRLSRGAIVSSATSTGTSSTSHDSANSTDLVPTSNAPTANSTSSSNAGSSSTATSQQYQAPTARLVLTTLQAAIEMGPRTQLLLCPPGSAKRSLRQRLQSTPTPGLTMTEAERALIHPFSVSALTQSMVMEDDVDDEDRVVDSSEDNDDVSSGDEDGLEWPHDHPDHGISVEPLYLDPIHANALSSHPTAVSPSNHPPHTMLPFGRRKFRYFDRITLQDEQSARRYVQRQFRRARRAQYFPHSEADFSLEPLQQPLTSRLAAALLLQGLVVNPVESLEGLAVCYDGLVAAGRAVLENTNSDEVMDSSTVLPAVSSLLLTYLSVPSAQVLLHLAHMRSLCGTSRYQRRFVQRIGPRLLRPPRGALWCLQHQRDMPAILAVTEVLLDLAPTMFHSNWWQRQASRPAVLREWKNNNSSATAGSLLLLGRQPHQQGSSMKGLPDWQAAAVLKHVSASVSSVLATDWTRVTPSYPPARRGRSSQQRSSPTPARYELETVFGPAFGSSASPTVPAQERTTEPQSPRAQPSTAEDDNATVASNTSNSMMPPRSPTGSPRPWGDTSPRQRMELVSGTTSAQNSPMAPVSSPATPISPSASSVGSAEMVSYRPSANTSPTTTSTATNYRLLTSTAAERKRTVAACRALRAQIQRFEDAFVQLHGRTPKGTAERAPLATTYAQYREWKRAIRADAACRIQALVRGAQTRQKLLQSSQWSRIVLRQRQPAVWQRIALPNVEQLGSSAAASTPSDVVQPSLAPQWASTVVRRRDPTPTSNSTSVFRSPEATDGTTGAGGGRSLEDLQARKRDLKRQLKQYDITFARRHGRMPVKAEKEPIRHLYEAYNNLKSQIGQLERDGGRASSVSSASSGGSPANSRLTVSPTVGAEGDDVDSTDSPLRRRSPNRVPTTPSPSGPVETPTPTTNTVAPSSPSSSLSSLRSEKSQLHQMLRSYERDFFEQHGRQVSSFSDIRPVASQYRRYKEIKRAIAQLQQQQHD